jgi:ABC-type bacteriocin/lantibiotic exporter with double-glycine peptidase domain
MNAINESPIFTHLTETINGLNTIKAYKVEGEFMKKMVNRLEENSKYLLID